MNAQINWIRTQTYFVLGVLAKCVEGESTRQTCHWQSRAGHADVAQGAGVGTFDVVSKQDEKIRKMNTGHFHS